MFTQLKEVMLDLYYHKVAYVLRTFCLQLALMLAAHFGLAELFNLILIAGNQVNLTKNNILGFFLNPLSLCAIFLYIFVLAFLVYLEFFFLVTILQKKSEKFKMNKRFWQSVWERFWVMIKGYQLFYFFLYVVLTIPVSGLFLTSSLLRNIYIPYFITDELTKSPLSAIGLAMGVLVLIYLNYRLIYTLPLVALHEKEAFSQQLIKSWKLTKGKLAKTVWGLFLLAIPALGFLIAFLFVLLFLLVFLENMASSVWEQGVVLVLVNGFLFAVAGLVKLGFVAYLLKHLGQLQFSQSPKISFARRCLSFVFSLLFFLLIGGSRAIGNLEQLTYDPYNKEILTIAHRGTVKTGVENSLEALEGAAVAKADYVEMDILLTADHQFVVIHDNNLKRLAGLDQKVSEMTLSELEGLPIHQGDFTSVLPSFETYVARAKELGIKLLVELKPHGDEPGNYPQLVIDKLKELQVEKTYKLMSLDLAVMEKIEKLAPEIETGHVIPLQLGNLSGEKVDFLLLEDFSYRDRLVWEAKLKKQDLYVWTINREEQMERYLQRPIAGMITDYPDLVQETKDDFAKNNSDLDRLLRLLK